MHVYVVEHPPGAPDESCVVPVAPLLRELILEALRLRRPYPLGGAEERLFRVLLDQVSFREVVPLHLPVPASAALAPIVEKLRRDPADGRTLAAWARTNGTSARTPRAPSGARPAQLRRLARSAAPDAGARVSSRASVP
jgi:hypothetical protein